LLKIILYNNLNIEQFIFIYYSLNYKSKEPQFTISLIPLKTETNTSLITMSYETYWRFINFYIMKTIHASYIINTDVEERCRFQHLEEIVKNLEDLIFTTTIRYNFIRQEQITRSILELF
jgi:F0F1-type ATP synthase gamma subunit